MQKEGEIKNQLELTQAYLENSKLYLNYFNGLKEQLSIRFVSLDQNHPIVKGGIQGIKQAYKKNEPIVIPLINTHLQYGEQLTELLNLFGDNRDFWGYEDSELVFYDAAFRNEVSVLYISLEESEGKINTLSDQLIQASMQ